MSPSDFGGRRDPQDPTGPGRGYPGDAVGPQYGPRIDPNGGDRPKRLPPVPPNVVYPPRTPEEYCNLLAWAFGCLISGAWTRDILQKFMEETARQFITPVAPPPWHVPPFNSRPLGGQATVTAAASASAYTTVISDRVDRGRYGVIRQIGQDTQNVAAGTGISDWAGLVWDIAIGPSLTNLISVPSYAAFSFQLGQIEAPTDAYILVPEGYYVVMRARSSTGVAIPGVSGMLRGWSWLIRGGRLDGSAKGVMGD